MCFPAAVIDCVLECVVGADHFVSWCGHDYGVAYISTGLSADDIIVTYMA